MRFGFTYPVVPFNKSAAFMVALFFLSVVPNRPDLVSVTATIDFWFHAVVIVL